MFFLCIYRNILKFLKKVSLYPEIVNFALPELVPLFGYGSFFKYLLSTLTSPILCLNITLFHM